MTQDESKRKAAEAALPYIKDVEILGVGTGSTVNHFIDCLADFNLTNDIKGAVSSSIATTERLKKIGIPVM
ncbi:ribose 5-phosphate isomerase A, partial [Methylococcaceae bacterium HT4]